VDAKRLHFFRERLPESHLSRRLIRQTEQVAMRFDVGTFAFSGFYWENFDR
jgi:hypothetical protein